MVVYIKSDDDIFSIEFGPNNNGMDVTSSLLEEAPAGPLLNTSPEHPDPQHLPMLHIGVPHHHPIDSSHVKQALEFAASKAYSVIRNNCIAVADFVVRVLTGNRVKNSPLVFDKIVGTVPEIDSPMLPMLQMMTQMTWFDIADGSRLMVEFLNAHGEHNIVSPAGPAEDAGPATTEIKKAIATVTAATADSSWSNDNAAKIRVDVESSSVSSKAKQGKSALTLAQPQQLIQALQQQQPSFTSSLPSE